AKSMVINFRLKINPSTSENKKTECLKELIKNFLKECLPKEKNEFKKISFFLGPTGVGKTLSIVKIAGEFSIKRKKKITIISIDFYKIGGEEQLKKYAEVLKLPCEFAFTPFQLEKLINIHSKESDYIFIDTPGISPNNKQLISQIQSFFKNDDINKILLFSSTTGINEIYHIWESFKFFKIDELGITKLDEAKSKGHILKFLIDVQIPIRFITFGTKVPEDIKFVNNDSLVSNLLGW
ncbi:MAG: hypothetical protein NZ891_02915, partial [bacterium]|nr:hypothetical protein [bacterium]MDW8163675.1 hypothetical protein [Candidatus Omnitrophota bacterium]